MATTEPLGERLVTALHGVHGEHAGFRAAHAKGTCCQGTFTASPDAARLTRAAHMQGTEVPVTIRFSNGSGAPTMPDYARGDGRGVAVKFQVPGGEIADIVGLTLPVFFARNPDDFLDFLAATTRDPATNKPDLATVMAFLEKHPETASALEAASGGALNASYLRCTFNSLHAFGLRDSADNIRWMRWRLEPEDGPETIENDEAREAGRDYLQEDLTTRLSQGPSAFRLLFRMADDEDSLVDPTSPWPESRESVYAGRLLVTGVVQDQDAGCAQLTFDPTTVVDGIELSDDPILHARSEAYSVSIANRKGVRAPNPGVTPYIGEGVTIRGGGTVPAGEMRAFEVDGASVAVANVRGDLHAFQDVCTHRGCPLSDGVLDGTSVTCACHGSIFDVLTGTVQRGPAKDPIAVYRVSREGDDLKLES
ncbi:MAG TPA: catalase [Candidatus Dormibacteraeota bacterium]|jgi:catalase|nr:catalase [Candidatus Dormibacteraeota bacterium]